MFGFWKKKQIAPSGLDVAPVPSGPPLNVDASLLTDIGCVRPVNQDYGAIVGPANSSGSGMLIAVADGMGGHKAGEVASRKAIEVISRIFFEGSGDPQAGLNRAFETANREIHAQSLAAEEWHGMGTTCTALALRGGMAYSAHVGDSRLYLVRGGGIYVLTEDHSAVMELVKQGVLTLAEARHHADKNVITRAMGSKPEVEVARWQEPMPVRPGDRFVLCSDGLYDRIEDTEIMEAALGGSPSEACANLIRMAKERGGQDNITVAVVHIGDPVAAGAAGSVQVEAKAPPPTREVEVPS